MKIHNLNSSECNWEVLQCAKNIYFNPAFLKAVEKNHPEIVFSYVVLIDKNSNPIAFATIQIVNFHFDDIKNDLELLIRKLKNIGRKLHILPNKKPLKIPCSPLTKVFPEISIFKGFLFGRICSFLPIFFNFLIKSSKSFLISSI